MTWNSFNTSLLTYLKVCIFCDLFGRCFTCRFGRKLGSISIFISRSSAVLPNTCTTCLFSTSATTSFATTTSWRYLPHGHCCYRLFRFNFCTRCTRLQLLPVRINIQWHSGRRWNYRGTTEGNGSLCGCTLLFLILFDARLTSFIRFVRRWKITAIISTTASIIL